MILTPNTPGAREAKVFDAVTGEALRTVVRVDTETLEAWVYQTEGALNRVRRTPDGMAIAIFLHPNPVRWEWPGLEDLL